ncbi:Glycosyltransferase involved in cell wall bisynthesis [Terriglobus roseus]|uniref:Glycosyltransferase involved in cell wall bisynthesis n=2 Tax=Terriglobus roseus TaxID=392734 RepID=A0A1H4L8A4_9BACT|nr:Glycosyltransferase involved in cell wall bisynthesis [Terriglobus roseus]
MRVAVLHHWFVTRGGGERVAECLAALLPSADLFTLVSSPEGLPDSLRGRTLTNSFLQKVPGAIGNHRHFMPLYPEAARSLDLRGYDLVVSSDSGPVKAATLGPDAVHLCYCHSPMRYLYDGYESYRATMGSVTRGLFSVTAPRVRRSDIAAAQRVTKFLANSAYVAERIRSAYRREADVVHPPIDLHRARLNIPGEAYLAAGRLVSYKKTGLMIEACERLGRPLRIAGSGPEEARLRRMAGPNTTFLGALPTEALWDEYSRARALLFAADEDFGMVPLEAQSCGRPVIAYGIGGSLETVRGAGEEGDSDELPPTGLFFAEQTADSLAEAILRFESQEDRFYPEAAQAHAAEFATPIFLANMRREILGVMPQAEPWAASVDDAIRTVG